MSSEDVLAVDREEVPHDDEDDEDADIIRSDCGVPLQLCLRTIASISLYSRIGWMFSSLELAVKMPSEIPTAVLS